VYNNKDLVSATSPENGTVSYTYYDTHRVATKTDAKGQQIAYSYDGLGRMTMAQRYYPSGGTLVEDASQRTTYSFDANPYDATYSQHVAGRLAAVQYSGGNCTSLGPPRTGCDTMQEMYTYSAAGGMLGKRVRVIRGGAQGDLNASWTYDNEGRVTGVTYPQWSNAGASVPGSSYNYAFDSMGRLNTMTDQLSLNALISGVTYGVANETLSMSGILNETRTYSNLFQLTRITVPGALDIQYAYSAAQNNGKIASQTDVISGEQVTYAYDALNRLASAVTSDNASVTQWGQSYNYDGFGNLTDQNVIKGSAPTMHVAYNYLTNRQTGDAADANGNLGTNYVYDIENRLLQAGTGAPQYAYDAGGQRVWRGSASPAMDEITYWSGSQKLAAYQVVVNGSAINFTLTGTNAYFGGRLIAKGTVNLGGTNDKVTLASVKSDRLGSFGKFYPYGLEKPSATTNDTEKFTGYFRDAATGLDYANARYHQPGVGRFMTPDPFGGSAKRRNPGSWNRYAYAGGNPVNYTDPTGLCNQGQSTAQCIWTGVVGGAQVIVGGLDAWAINGSAGLAIPILGGQAISNLTSGYNNLQQAFTSDGPNAWLTTISTLSNPATALVAVASGNIDATNTASSQTSAVSSLATFVATAVSNPPGSIKNLPALVSYVAGTATSVNALLPSSDSIQLTPATPAPFPYVPLSPLPVPAPPAVNVIVTNPEPTVMDVTGTSDSVDYAFMDIGGGGGGGGGFHEEESAGFDDNF
jgi:RHS repeat-associated protein